MKQTAVEWLQEAISIHLTFEQQMQFEGLFQQAIEMEKKQIIDALRQGVNIELGINEFKENYLTYSQNFDRYYNLKYGKDEQLQTKYDQ